ncbi:MAG: DUF87 domain-containing protein, partial [Anaerolineales bacterium]|nr:DUF87 domain-containing protein [Anaerolineales bacterium]
MSIIELQPYDLYTNPAERLYALQPLWANLANLGARSARLLIVTDHINYEAALHGFNQVAVPFDQLVRDLRWYRSYYEQYLQQTIRETQYIRLFLIVSSTLDDQTLHRLIEGYGIRTRPLDSEGIPLPFSTADPHWDYAVDPHSRHWGAVQSEINQTGAVVAQTLHKLFALEFPVYVAIDIWNYGRAEAVQLLKTKAAVASVQFLGQKAGHEQRLEATETQAAIDAFRKEIGTVGVGIHEVRVTIAVGGNSLSELTSRLELVRGACPLDLSKKRAQVTVIRQMFSAEPPTERDGSLATSTHVTVLAGSALSYSRPTKMDGVLLGFDTYQAPVVVDLFDPANSAYNAVVIGQTGSGKSFFVTLLMIRSLLTGARLVIIDPKGDIDLSWLGQDQHGRELCRLIRVGTSGSSVNILEPTFPELNNQIEFVLGGLRMLGVYQNEERLKHTLLDVALHELYQATWGKAQTAAPTLPDLREQVLAIGQQEGGEVQQAA